MGFSVTPRRVKETVCPLKTLLQRQQLFSNSVIPAHCSGLWLAVSFNRHGLWGPDAPTSSLLLCACLCEVGDNQVSHWTENAPKPWWRINAKKSGLRMSSYRRSSQASFFYIEGAREFTFSNVQGVQGNQEPFWVCRSGWLTSTREGIQGRAA